MSQGSSTMTTEPSAAPRMLPRPPMTTATTSSSEKASGVGAGADGLRRRSRARRRRRPAATELTVNASTLTRPAADAAQPRGHLVVAHRAHPQPEPPAAQHGQRRSRPPRRRRWPPIACHCSSAITAAQRVGHPVERRSARPWSPLQHAPTRCEATAGSAITSGERETRQVRPGQPRGGEPEEQADDAAPRARRPAARARSAGDAVDTGRARWRSGRSRSRRPP